MLILTFVRSRKNPGVPGLPILTDMKQLLTFLFIALMLITRSQAQPSRSAKTSYSWSAAMEFYLRQIQTGPIDQIGYQVYNIAATWAAAGFIAPANQLLTTWWSYKTRDPEDYQFMNNGFQIMWALSGQQPDSLPVKLREVNDIVQDNWTDVLGFPGLWPADFRARLENKPWTKVGDSLLAAKAIQMSYDAHNSTHRASREQRQQAVQAFSRYLANHRVEGYEGFHYTASATLVAASVGEDDAATAFMRYWGEGYLQYPQNYTLSKLMCDTATARLLLRGVLAPVWGLTRTSCDADLARVRDVLGQRITKGPSLVYGYLPLKTVLDSMAVQAIKSGEIVYDKEVTGKSWLGYAPADTVAITAAEQRLGVTFPDEYRSFLLLTNGWRATGYTGASFLPVEKIGWLKDLDAQLVEIFGAALDDIDPQQAAGFRRSILIGGLHEEQQVLLVPPGGKDTAWQCWYYASSLPGILPYPSLRFYLEHLLWGMEDAAKRR